MLPTIDELAKKYLDHVVAYICNVTVTDPATGGQEDPDEKFMRAVEMAGSRPIHEMTADDFRRSLLAPAAKNKPVSQMPQLLGKLITFQCMLLSKIIKVPPEAFSDTARTIAAVARDNNDYATAPILADACQDPGDIPEMVCEHLRGSKPHRCHLMDYIAYPKKETV